MLSLLNVLCTIYNSLWCIVDSYIAVYKFIKRCHVCFFLLICRKSCEVGKEGIVSIVILKLRNLRLTLVPTWPYPMAAWAVVLRSTCGSLEGGCAVTMWGLPD